MRLFIELPTWLGDSVMVSMAIELICKNFPASQITFFGNKTCLQLFAAHPNAARFISDESKKAKFRLINLAKTMRNLGVFDAAISFRGAFSAKFGLFFIKARKKAVFDKRITRENFGEFAKIWSKNSANLSEKFGANSDVNSDEISSKNAKFSRNLKVNFGENGDENSTRNLGENLSANSQILHSSTDAKFGANSLTNSDQFRPNFAQISAKFSTKARTHQAEKYALFVAAFFSFMPEFSALKLHFAPRNLARITLGINPGASYGSAKRWYPSYFAQVAKEFANEFDIVIFGGAGEREICDEIARNLARCGVKFQNLCGKTNIKELCEIIGGIDKSGGIFITNDSGPMHIAAAYGVATVALFGPTRCDETAPYANKNAQILRLNLACMPCMKRVCPLGTHACMRDLAPQMAIEAVKELIYAKKYL